MSSVRYVLTDIEGTTTPITFVHDVLFPYSAERLARFVEERGSEPAVRAELAKVGASDDRAAVQQLLQWIKEDKKHPALKALQGMIWKDGYESGAFTSIVYDDVAPALRAWRERGLGLGVYSSGSVPAQKLLFRYTNVGDLTPLFSDYFDTAVGAKRERQSYARIREALGLPAGAILFLSDIAEELDAAKDEGYRTVQLLRPGTAASGRHVEARTFADVPC